MEPAVVRLPPQYIVFDLSGAGLLRCFGPPPPAAEHVGVPFGTEATGLEALHRTRLSRADLATTSVHAETSDPDTVSDAGTSGVQVAEESDDEVDSFDAFLRQETFARKIEALAELVGIKGAYEPVAVLGEVVKVIQSINTKRECSL
ncbi:hypothetical protein BDA96_03G276000 [Sorghum bicolor]|jgi:hypothetical protein|uniref:Uncharacterized protein n=1 Tax=Sorghum bicolor TaxID=4558 RepID=A0A921RG05_SORBI|nr:hypothetical protein BDA96_03G276000 [Sorghum bicolor]KAG0538893.1 hypothetical protein BDA96_03G276000 [Sorghum bicolor]